MATERIKASYDVKRGPQGMWADIVAATEHKQRRELRVSRDLLETMVKDKRFVSAIDLNMPSKKIRMGHVGRIWGMLLTADSYHQNHSMSGLQYIVLCD